MMMVYCYSDALAGSLRGIACSHEKKMEKLAQYGSLGKYLGMKPLVRRYGPRYLVGWWRFCYDRVSRVPTSQQTVTKKISSNFVEKKINTYQNLICENHACTS